MSLVAPQHVGSSRSGSWTHVSCTGRQILYHWAAREALAHFLNYIVWFLIKSVKSSLYILCFVFFLTRVKQFSSVYIYMFVEKKMVTYSNILAWRIPWTEEPGGLQSKGSQRVGHDWVTNTHTYIYVSHFLYPLVCWWILRLFLCLGCCK